MNEINAPQKRRGGRHHLDGAKAPLHIRRHGVLIRIFGAVAALRTPTDIFPEH
jgi:hypothetical protein